MILLFSQGHALHSRLGNSLVWMSRINSWLSTIDFNLEIVFPWSIENFSSYLDVSSPWLRKNQIADNLYLEFFNIPLTSQNLSLQSILIERELKANKINDVGNKYIAESIGGKYLYLSGNFDLTSLNIQDLIRNHDLTICHEPYDILRNENMAIFKGDFSNLGPQRLFFENQLQLVKSKSSGRVSVGLHIRRGDYAKWNSGEYFYDDKYWIDKVFDLISRNKAVWIFSNDLSEELSNKLEKMGAFISRESFSLDFIRLMAMDQIIGPPSTFTSMAIKISGEVLGRKIVLNFLPGIKNT